MGPSDFHRLKVTVLLKKMLKGACFSFRRPAVVYIGSIGKYPVYSISTLSFSIFHQLETEYRCFTNSSQANQLRELNRKFTCLMKLKNGLSARFFVVIFINQN